MSENSGRRFPIERSRYYQSVGRLLPHRIGQIFQELGFETKICLGQSNGVDLVVFKADELVLVAEIVNWSLPSEMAYKRKSEIISNLSEYSCKRVLIYTAFENENILRDLAINGIAILKF